MLQPKDMDWLNGYRNKTPMNASYKRLTSDLEPYINWKWGHGKMYLMQIEIKRKPEWQYLDKIGFKIKTVTPSVHNSFITIAKVWKQPVSINRWMDKEDDVLYIYTYTHTHTHTRTHTMEYYSAIKKNEILPYAATWMDLEGIMLSEISQRKINTIWYHLYVESKKYNKLVNKAKKK